MPLLGQSTPALFVCNVVVAVLNNFVSDVGTLFLKS